MALYISFQRFTFTNTKMLGAWSVLVRYFPYSTLILTIMMIGIVHFTEADDRYQSIKEGKPQEYNKHEGFKVFLSFCLAVNILLCVWYNS
jgi:hypothetical protein